MSTTLTGVRSDEKRPEVIKKAIALLRSDIRFFKKADFQINIAMCHLEIAMLYEKLGDKSVAEKEREAALAIYRKKQDFISACLIAEILGKKALVKKLKAKIVPKLPMSDNRRMRIISDGVNALTAVNAS